MASRHWAVALAVLSLAGCKPDSSKEPDSGVAKDAPRADSAPDGTDVLAADVARLADADAAVTPARDDALDVLSVREDGPVTGPDAPARLDLALEVAVKDVPQPTTDVATDPAITIDAAPVTETLSCPAGHLRVHVRDLWSAAVSPTLATLSSQPAGLLVVASASGFASYGARIDGRTDTSGAGPCTYYSACIPSGTGKIQVQAIGADTCAAGTPSGAFDLAAFAKNQEIWIEYNGQSGTLATDYGAASIGSAGFHVVSDPATLMHPACALGIAPERATPDGFTKVHFRWPWNDPADPKTPYPGTACPADFAKMTGLAVPPYPSSLKVTGLACTTVALSECQDGTCPWYDVLIPNSAWPATGSGPKLVFRHPDDAKNLLTNNIPLPARTASEYWIAYAGAPDNTLASVTKCQDWSLRSDAYFVYTDNPGPGYGGCGGGSKPVDPCNPPLPSGYHTVHFRYLWAGQRTFTLFPKPSLMPKWITLQVASAGNSLDVICQREQDRPWFACPVPDSAFTASTTWRAVDRTHAPEWNTVKPWPLPATPNEYWIRWNYGKPDIPRDKDPANFKVFDYDPDGANGDWAATGAWNDSACVAKPPATPVLVGFGNGAWFPYARTGFAYPHGGSFYAGNSAAQDAINGFVWERYQLWKQAWVREGSDACGAGTARVYSDIPEGTVSEGQGYGMAIAAAIGDKELVGKLWEFVRRFRSEDKYCHMMGWIWSSSTDCLQPDASGTDGSAFDGDVDIAIGLVYAALQWPDDYTDVAVAWLKGLECEINAKYGDGYNYPTAGDSWDKGLCDANKCDYAPKTNNTVYIDYYPPGYFRVFGDFLAAKLGGGAKASNGQSYRDFWYKTAESVWELVERCYDQSGVHPGLMGNQGHVDKPCSSGGGEPYEWGRALWRLAIDAAWFGHDSSLPENAPGSSAHYAGKSRLQAKMDNIQDFYTDFYKSNPPEPDANRFSTICHQLGTDGTVKNCDPAYGHNSYTVNLAMAPYTTRFDDAGKTTSDIRREAIEESLSTTVANTHYFEESLGVYSLLFLTGNFPNPMAYPAR